MKTSKEKGVWLDFRKAHIVTVQDGKSTMFSFDSEMEDFNPKGGYGGATPYGPQDSISESKYLERRKQQSKKYYSQIIDHLKDADSVIILGPGEARVGLTKAIESNNELKIKLRGVFAEDSMTDNQVMAKVREFYASDN